MLYVTTRNNCDTFPAPKALGEARAADGGWYQPFQTPELPEGLTGNEALAQVLGQLFPCRLSRWDVDFAVGRYPVRLVNLRQKILVAELWHNPQWSFSWMADQLQQLLTGQPEPAGPWMKIAARIGLLTGIFGELAAHGFREPMDIALVSGDFSGPISAWYGRKWGLPIGNILCCCNENNGLWDLICHGQLRTDNPPIATSVPEADVPVPEQLERLISQAGGPEEVDFFLECCRRGRTYTPEEGVFSEICRGMAASVVSSQRLESIIKGAYDTHQYVLSPASALAYGGLMDYRAKTGNIRPTLVLTEDTPARRRDFVSQALGISPEELNGIL